MTGAAPDSIEGLLFPSGAWASQRTTSNTFPQFSLTHSHASAWSGASSAAAPPQHYRARQQASEPGARGGSGGGAISFEAIVLFVITLRGFPVCARALVAFSAPLNLTHMSTCVCVCEVQRG